MLSLDETGVMGLGKNKEQRGKVPFSLHHIRQYMISILFMIGDFNLGQFVSSL